MPCLAIHYMFRYETIVRCYLLTYVLTPRSRALLEKLIGSQLFKKFPAFYRTGRFITAFTKSRHCPYPEPDQYSPYPHIPLPEYPN